MRAVRLHPVRRYSNIQRALPVTTYPVPQIVREYRQRNELNRGVSRDTPIQIKHSIPSIGHIKKQIYKIERAHFYTACFSTAIAGGEMTVLYFAKNFDSNFASVSDFIASPGCHCILFGSAVALSVGQLLMITVINDTLEKIKAYEDKI